MPAQAPMGQPPVLSLYWCPSSSGSFWGASHLRGAVVGAVLFPKVGAAEGQTLGQTVREGFGLRGAAFSIAVCLAPGFSCGSVVSLQTLLRLLPRVLLVFRKCKYPERGIFHSLFPCTGCSTV